MADIGNRSTRSPSLLSAVLTSLSARIAQLVRAELRTTLVAELERHFNERLLPELHGKVEAIVVLQLAAREGMINRATPTKRSLQDNVLMERFSRVFHDNSWLDSETVSGPGSRKDSESVTLALSALETVKGMVKFVSINDIPCGDFNWIHNFLIYAPDISYRGFDIVPTLIEQNRMLYPQYKFHVLDITSSPPPYSDLIFAKDLFNHLLYVDIRKALSKMKESGSKYLLASNNFSYTNEELAVNSGACSRYLDLCSEPFNLRPPLWKSHYMGLWKFADIEIED